MKMRLESIGNEKELKAHVDALRSEVEVTRNYTPTPHTTRSLRATCDRQRLTRQARPRRSSRHETRGECGHDAT